VAVRLLFLSPSAWHDFRNGIDDGTAEQKKVNAFVLQRLLNSDKQRRVSLAEIETLETNIKRRNGQASTDEAAEAELEALQLLSKRYEQVSGIVAQVKAQLVAVK
jgi:hypothetical protein